VEADKNVSDVNRATKIGDRPSSSVEDGLKTSEYRSFISVVWYKSCRTRRSGQDSTSS